MCFMGGVLGVRQAGPKPDMYDYFIIIYIKVHLSYQLIIWTYIQTLLNFNPVHLFITFVKEYY